MASKSGLPWRLSAALWAERRMPVLARRMRPKPVLPGEPGTHGTVYRGGDSGPLLLLIGDPGAAPDWLGSALAAALGGVAVVVQDDSEADGSTADAEASRARSVERLSAAVAAAGSLGSDRDRVAAAGSLGSDRDRVAVIGVGDGATAALTALTGASIQPLVRRLVLLAPASATRLELGGTPPTFLQSSPQSMTLTVSRSLEIDLREAGVAVRPVEYAGLPDAWVRFPRFAPGSRRAVEDIVAFLRRGFGMEGTFSGVIPGWDLK